MVLNIVCMVLALGSGISFIVFLLLSGEFEDYIKPLDKKQFMLPEVYGVGFKLLQLSKFEFKSRGAQQLRENASILYGEKYADYYMRVFYAQRISLVYMFFAVASAISCLTEGSDKLIILVLGVVVCATIYYYFTTVPAARVKERSRLFMLEFPNAVSTIALLVNSGMILREAWREVSLSDDSELYLEMRKVNEDIDNGIAEMDALFSFANRCVTPEIKKFTAFVVQGLEKGNRDLAIALRNQTDELWEIKKQNILKQGELASSKLMIPLMIMFAGILVMVMGPIMTNLGI